MKTIAPLNYELPKMASEAARAEAEGADVIAAGELDHDPLFLLAMAATSTSKAQLMTSISVAFARSPMTLALQAHDVNVLSKGRLLLGVGSQIKPHIEKRYNMPWSKPAARMREFVLAVKAIWACWYDGVPLDFRGEFYSHTLMTPMFEPSDKSYGPPPLFVAGVGPLMTENAAEVADGVLLHGLNTEEYIRSVTLPAVEAGLKKSGRTRKDLQIVGSPFLVTGETEEQFNAVKQSVCAQIAFYASTPAYRAILESVGYGDLHPELLALSKQGEWVEMGRRIDDTLLDKIALVGEPEQIADKLKQRYGDIFDLCGSSLMGGHAYSEMNYHSALGEAIKEV